MFLLDCDDFLAKTTFPDSSREQGSAGSSAIKRKHDDEVEDANDQYIGMEPRMLKKRCTSTVH